MNKMKVFKNYSHPISDKKVRTKNSKQKHKYSSSSNNAFSIAMSTWAENFTMASNWQMKHQLAFWKGRAKTLEYENKFLHEVIKTNFLKTTTEAAAQEKVSDQEVLQEPVEENTDGEYYEENTEEYDEYIENNSDEFVVSAEFIEFVRTNAKFKEDAKREREKLKREQNKETEIEDNVMTEDKLKELYGEKWQRVCALEMSLLTDFMKKKEDYKATYWPNIPLNLN